MLFLFDALHDQDLEFRTVGCVLLGRYCARNLGYSSCSCSEIVLMHSAALQSLHSQGSSLLLIFGIHVHCSVLSAEFGLQWRRTPHSPKLQHYWSLTIRIFSVMSRILGWEVWRLCRDSVGVFYSPSWLGHKTVFTMSSDYSLEKEWDWRR